MRNAKNLSNKVSLSKLILYEKREKYWHLINRIGLLFLLNNLNLIKVSIVELIRVYWPVILIWIGIDKLISKSEEKNS